MSWYQNKCWCACENIPWTIIRYQSRRYKTAFDKHKDCKKGLLLKQDFGLICPFAEHALLHLSQSIRTIMVQTWKLLISSQNSMHGFLQFLQTEHRTEHSMFTSSYFLPLPIKMCVIGLLCSLYAKGPQVLDTGLSLAPTVYCIFSCFNNKAVIV